METSLGDLLFGIGGLLAGIGAFIAFTKFAKLAEHMIRTDNEENDEQGE